MLDQLRNLIRIRGFWPKFSWGLFHLTSSAKLMTLTLLVISPRPMLYDHRPNSAVVIE